MTTIGTLQNDVARLEQQRHDDHLHYTVTTGARMLSHILRARQKTAVRRRWEAWQVSPLNQPIGPIPIS